VTDPAYLAERADIAENAGSRHGYRIVEQSPILRHLRAEPQPAAL
jgi:hypothetical protein